MSHNFYLASTLSKIKLSDEEIFRTNQKIDSLVQTEFGQTEFYDYCKIWKLAPWLYTRLSNENILHKFTPLVQQKFKENHASVKLENESRNQEAIKFLTEFSKNSIDVALLKGNLLAHTVYNDTGYKRMNDFDLLIHPSDWLKVQDIYSDLGYIPLGFGWGGEKQKPAKYSHVGMSFISPNFNCIVGTQWGLKSPTTHYTVNIKNAWESAIPFNFYNLTIKQLSTEYNLLHLILHMGIYKCGIRDCMDVYNLFLANESINVDRFYKILLESQAIDKAMFTLALSNYCSASIPNKIMEMVKGNNNKYITTRLNRRLLSASYPMDIHISYNDYFQDIEKSVIYFNLFPQFHKKLLLYIRILQQIFWPNIKMSLKLNDKNHHSNFYNKLVSRIKAPMLVLRLIGEEIGRYITPLLLSKLFLNLVFSIKNYVFKKESYFNFLEKRGVDVQKIKNTVNNIQ